ncbi:hypothetical protein BJM49_10860 [Listeria monocytogenes]|uniref:hypothetical protein n=1 Tax=Listeria monocytogenes TaxID=1639 RepID=UPI0008753791|nr:hypothetical protein [Listeria monocytogenes]EAC7320185.1 hypothetical protein [Listeria monocytogenes]EAD0022472.1 hypothetical protein [Listeria monocytogenes]EAD9897666.1 hypothetical protein [Listeria monocytogenes]EAF6093343.1 hypothetical protein [Listeria monocytogenes]ECB9829207.1 hypothetical protein [Listeria monocytogenes]
MDKLTLKWLEEEECRIFLNGIDTNFERVQNPVNEEDLVEMINNNQVELYMNREHDCLNPLDISFPDEWESHYQNHICFLEEDSQSNYTNGYFYFVSVFQRGIDRLVIFKYSH